MFTKCIIFLSLFAIPFFANSCDHTSLRGNIEFVAQDESGDSKYQGYVLREGDYLFIRNFSVWNNGNCTLEEIKISISLIKPSGEEFQFCTPYFQINSLGPDEYYSIQPDLDWMGEKDVITCGSNLNEIGVYEINHELILETQSPTSGYSLGVNGIIGNKYISVKSISELEELEANKESLEQAKTANNLAYFGILVALSGVFLSLVLSLRNQLQNIYFWVMNKFYDLHLPPLSSSCSSLRLGESLPLALGSSLVKISVWDLVQRDSLVGGDEVVILILDKEGNTLYTPFSMGVGVKEFRLPDSSARFKIRIRKIYIGDGYKCVDISAYSEDEVKSQKNEMAGSTGKNFENRQVKTTEDGMDQKTREEKSLDNGNDSLGNKL